MDRQPNEVSHRALARYNRPPPDRWAVEIKVFGETGYTRNAVTYATKDEAQLAGEQLYARWSAVEEYRIVEVAE